MNPYLRPNPRPSPILLPARVQPLSGHVLAVLIAVNPKTYRGMFAYVFDSTASADAAVQREPLAQWMGSNVVRAKVANVVILANVTGSSVRQVHTAIASLSG